MSPWRRPRHPRILVARGLLQLQLLVQAVLADVGWSPQPPTLPPLLASFCDPCVDAASCSIGAVVDLDGSGAALDGGGNRQLPILRGRHEPTLLFPDPDARGPAAVALRQLVELFANETTALELLVGNLTVQWSRESAHIVKNRGEGFSLAAAEGVGRVAIDAAQRATGQADEHRRPAHRTRFALQRQENLGDAQALHVAA